MRPIKQAVYSSRTADKFVVRLPDGMREKIAEVARTHHRSMNSEIISRLERSMLEDVGDDDVTSSSRVEELAAKLNIQPWAPQVGQVVRRRDSKIILGVITEFKVSSTGLVAKTEIDYEGVAKNAETPVGILELVDIFEVIEMSNGTVHKALERIAAK